MNNSRADDLQLLTAKEIAKLTGINVQKVRELIKSGYFPKAAIPGRIMRVLKVEVQRVLREARSLR